MELNKKWGLPLLIFLAVVLIVLLIYKLLPTKGQEKTEDTLTEPISLKSDEDEGILHLTEVSPMFPGCEELAADMEKQKACADDKLLKYLYGKIKYPEYALQHDIEGRCVVTFVVETDGSISHAKILKDIGGGCGEEAVRVVNSMNELPQRWSPGKDKGKTVRVRFNLPVKFQLENKEQ